MDINQQAVELACPTCGSRFQETVGRLKENPTAHCPNCRQPIRISSADLRALEEGDDDA